MKFGFCGGIEQASLIKSWGYDFLETPLAPLAELPDTEFAEALKKYEKCGIACLVCNGFLTRSVPVVGPAADIAAGERYVRGALARASCLGAEIVVFGSSGSRGIPAGFPAGQAWKQLTAFAAMAASVAAHYGITLAFEPLNAIECNFINRTGEAWLVAQSVQQDHFKVLADYYHMMVEREDLAVLDIVGKDLCHVHTASLLGRKIPGRRDRLSQGNLINTLQNAGYTGNLSIEAGSWLDLNAEACEALAMFRELSAGSAKPAAD